MQGLRRTVQPPHFVFCCTLSMGDEVVSARFRDRTSWNEQAARGCTSYAEILKSSPLAQSAAVQPFIVPPFPYIAEVADLLKGTRVKVGAQNMHWDDKGAWTGEVSPLMVKDCGATLVELGHSERRTFFNETDEAVGLKVKACLAHGLTALVCIGDTRSE